MSKESETYIEPSHAYDMSIHSNPSALAWVTFFREHNPECNLDDNVMLAWFANAMMAMHDHIYQTTQPEQEPEPLLAETKIEWYGKGFRQGVNEFAPPKPLTEDVIYALDKEGIVENMDDHQVRYVIRWIRRVEKAHGIGGGNE